MSPHRPIGPHETPSQASLRCAIVDAQAQIMGALEVFDTGQVRDGAQRALLRLAMSALQTARLPAEERLGAADTAMTSAWSRVVDVMVRRAA